MPKIAPKTFCFLFFGLFAAACGDPGDPAFDAEGRFEDVAAEGEGPFAEAPSDQPTDELDGLELQSPEVEELSAVPPGDSSSVVDEIISNPGLIEPIGGSELGKTELSESELAELEALGVDVPIGNEPSRVDDQVVEATLALELTRTANGGGAVLEAQSCERSLSLEIRADALAARGICGVFAYDIDARLVDDGRVAGEITIEHEGVALIAEVEGLLSGNRLVFIVEHERVFAPDFRDFLEGEVIADLR